MRIVVHDYAGHLLVLSLSRALAARGHHVLHLSSGSFSTPQGDHERRPDDPETFQVEQIKLPTKVDKGNVFKRRQADIEHGRRVVERLATYKPEIILSANTPLDAQRMMLEYAHTHGMRFVFWVQDLIGQAIKRLMAGKFFGIGSIAGSYYVRLENRLLSESDKIVVISEDFRPYLPTNVQNTPKVHVVENWAHLGDVPIKERVNPWSEAHGFSGGLNFLYSGTLGMKHNPELLVQLAVELEGKGRMIVVSEGQSIDFLKQRMLELKLENLHLLPFQHFSALPEMLASADVLVAVLEADAGVFSVPSKVLTYLCAGKPLLLAIPLENLAARIATQNKAGLVVNPDDADGFIANARILASDETLRTEMGAAGRAYAERTFAIDTITDKFERILKA